MKPWYVHGAGQHGVSAGADDLAHAGLLSRLAKPFNPTRPRAALAVSHTLRKDFKGSAFNGVQGPKPLALLPSGLSRRRRNAARRGGAVGVVDRLAVLAQAAGELLVAAVAVRQPVGGDAWAGRSTRTACRRSSVRRAGSGSATGRPGPPGARRRRRPRGRHGSAVAAPRRSPLQAPPPAGSRAGWRAEVVGVVGARQRAGLGSRGWSCGASSPVARRAGLIVLVTSLPQRRNGRPGWRQRPPGLRRHGGPAAMGSIARIAASSNRASRPSGQAAAAASST